MIALPGTPSIRGIVTIVGLVALGALMLGGLYLTVRWLIPERDITPIVVARKDERTAAAASAAVGAGTAQANRDTTIHLDLTTKEIRDAFDAPPPPAPQPTVASTALPPAPVDRLRDRLNEGIARANRAADAAAATD